MKVCILMGGCSREREISIKSAEEILQSIDTKKYNVYVVDIDTNNQNNLIKLVLDLSPDIVIISLYGSLGADGSIQGLLKCMNIPFIGNNLMSCSLGNNKAITKDLLKFNFIPITDYVLLKNIEEIDLKIREINKLGYPLVVKPNRGGSSIGINIVSEEIHLKEAIQKIQLLEDDILIEKYIQGQEVVCCIIENNNELEVITILKHDKKNNFYQYNFKDDNKFLSLEESFPNFLQTMIKEIAKKVFKVIECNQYATVHMIVNEEQINVIEVNTLPKLTSGSLMHKAAINKFGGLGNFIDTLIKDRMNL